MFSRMVKWCCTFGCSNKEGRDDVSFYRFPLQTRKRKGGPEGAQNRRILWVNAVKRAAVNSTSKAWEPSQHDRLCSAHFISGKFCIKLFTGDFESISV